MEAEGWEDEDDDEYDGSWPLFDPDKFNNDNGPLGV